jgi:hypothetical protein
MEARVGFMAYSCIERFMKTRIDIKSVLIGLLAGIAAMLAVGASSSTPVVGRYQVGGTASQGFVVDTVTGQVWTRFTPSGSGTSDNDFALPKLREKK